LDENLYLNFLKIKKLKNSCFVVVSKSGNTIETIVNLDAILSKIKSKNKLVIITEINDNNLFHLASKFNAEIIEHKNYIGGRYSVLSEAGMFPAKLMGLKTEKFRSLEKLISKLDLSSRVKLLGEIKNPLSYVEKAKILVIPSLWEGLPRVAVEAQALKTPIISSCEEGGLGEILMNGDAGQITKKNDPIEMKNAIEKYIQDENLAKDHIKLAYDNLNRFSLSSSSKKYLDIFSRY